MANQSVIGFVGPLSVVTTTETGLAINPAFNFNNPGGQGNEIRGVVNITAGTGTTAVTVRVRQGSGSSGAIVGAAATHTLAAGASASIPYSFIDPATSGTAQQYTATIQQVGASGNGTVNVATMAILPSTSAF